jgi:hypothetical protein
MKDECFIPYHARPTVTQNQIKEAWAIAEVLEYLALQTSSGIQSNGVTKNTTHIGLLER